MSWEVGKACIHPWREIIEWEQNKKAVTFSFIVKMSPLLWTDCVYFLKILLWSKLLTVILIREKVNKFGNV